MSRELIYVCENGGLNFGDFSLNQKTKLDNFEFNGDIYKVKTFKEITKLEKNGMFVYESVPGTEVTRFKPDAAGAAFTVDGMDNTQIIVGLEDDTEYEVYLDEAKVAIMKTNMGGKLVLSLELGSAPVAVKIVKY